MSPRSMMLRRSGPASHHFRISLRLIIFSLGKFLRFGRTVAICSASTPNHSASGFQTASHPSVGMRRPPRSQSLLYGRHTNEQAEQGGKKRGVRLGHNS